VEFLKRLKVEIAFCINMQLQAFPEGLWKKKKLRVVDKCEESKDVPRI
jgi:hypothetical protein